MLERLEQPAGELGTSSGYACSARVLGTAGAFVCEMPYMQESRADAVKHGLWRPRPSEIHLLFLSLRFRGAGLRFAGALGAVPVDARGFFLSALGFLASRLLLF